MSTLREDLDALRALLETAVRAAAKYVDRCEGGLHAIEEAFGSVPGSPAQPVPVTPPRPPAPPGTPEGLFVGAVLATCWGNKEDEESNSWTSLAYGWAPKPTSGSGKSQLGASLPARVPQGTQVDVRLAATATKPAGPWCRGNPVIDIGPWSTRDPYWETGARPAAEADRGELVVWDHAAGKWTPGDGARALKDNGAGIDLTPAVWAKLLGEDPAAVWAKSPSGRVDIVVRYP